MLQQDTIAIGPVTSAFDDTATTVSSKTITPYQVLRMLPRDATPEQQDSAIQARFHPAQIRYSNQPDTLHLPGHEVPKDPSEVNIPQYYKEVFFARELAVPEASPNKYGVAGDPLPYTVRGDNTMTLLLLFSFICFVLSVGHSWNFFSRQLKELVYHPHTDDFMSETLGEIHVQLFLVAQTCLLLAVGTFSYAIRFVSDTYVLDYDLQLIALYFAVFVIYFSLRYACYSGVNKLFFSSKGNLQMIRSLLFLTGAEGVLLFPAVLLQVYFGLSIEIVTYYYIFVVFLIKTLIIYKSWRIFFGQNVFSLQIILYFCALEIVPLLSLMGILWMLTNMLKINF